MSKSIDQLQQENEQLKKKLADWKDGTMICNYEKQLADKDKKNAELEDWYKWYEMWHKKFKKQIEELTTELETYRPTKLTGEGQTTCHQCKQRNWTCFGFYHYKGQTLCDECLKKVLKEDNKGNQQLRYEICDEIRNTAGKYWTRLEDDNENLVDYYITPKDLDDIIDEIRGKK